MELIKSLIIFVLCNISQAKLVLSLCCVPVTCSDFLSSFLRRTMHKTFILGKFFTAENNSCYGRKINIKENRNNSLLF